MCVSPAPWGSRSGIWKLQPVLKQGLCTESSHTLLRKRVPRAARQGLHTLCPWAEQAAWTRSQRQAASSCGALCMATTSHMDSSLN